MNKLLDGKVAIVTGAGGGLGSATARGLVQAGTYVVIAEIDADAGEAVAAEIRAAGGQAISHVCDVSSADSISALVQHTTAAFGGVDILINNAAIYPSRPWTDVSEEEWDHVFDVNVKGYFLCARAVYPVMKARGWGKIVNFSSLTFFLGRWSNLSTYISSKGAIVGLTKALARELGPDNITVNCIAPGAFPTDAEKIHPDPEGYNAWVLEQQALKRRGTPDDIANAVLFFASPMSDFITGQTLLVDGGWLMR